MRSKTSPDKALAMVTKTRKLIEVFRERLSVQAAKYPGHQDTVNDRAMELAELSEAIDTMESLMKFNARTSICIVQFVERVKQENIPVSGKEYEAMEAMCQEIETIFNTE